ncbi:MAG: hypothetical protein IJI22_03925 [Bacilli bacterium]|nr:hypothetical protein [Bacilli bacterium]
MRIEKITDTDYKICILFKIVDDYEKNIERIIIKLRKKLNLCGFYKVYMIIRDFGIFLILKKVDNSYYRDVLNIKFIKSDNLNVYFVTKDYFILDREKEILYYNGYYYSLVDSAVDVIRISEFGTFVFGECLNKILEEAVIV